MTHPAPFISMSSLLLSLFLLGCLLTSPAYTQESQAIGRVLSTSGSVTARDLEGPLETSADVRIFLPEIR